MTNLSTLFPAGGVSTGTAIKNSLAAWYDLSDNTDAHSNGIDLDQSGGTPTYVTGKVGNAVNVNGTPDWINATDAQRAAGGIGSFSVFGWVNADTITGNPGIVSNCSGLSTSALSWAVRILSNEISFLVSDGGYQSISASTFGSISLDTWYFFYAYHNASTGVLGVSVNNGTEDTLGSVGTVNVGADWPLCIGRYYGYAGNYFDGLVDSLGIADRVLTSAEITWLYNSGSGRVYADL